MGRIALQEVGDTQMTKSYVRQLLILADGNKNCSPQKVKKYKGVRRPTCNGGTGCVACWDKWWRT